MTKAPSNQKTTIHRDSRYEAHFIELSQALAQARDELAQYKRALALSEDFLTRSLTELDKTKIALRDEVTNHALTTDTFNETLAQLRQELTIIKADVRRVNAERTLLTETTIKEAMNGIRILHWGARVIYREELKGDFPFEWQRIFANEEMIRLWLPIAKRPGEQFTTDWTHAISATDHRELRAKEKEALLTGQPGYSHEYRIALTNGDMIWVREEVGITPDGTNSWRLIGKCTDITSDKRRDEHRELIAAQAKLENLAFRDGLTGLHNHRAFHERLNQDFERAAQCHLPLSLIMLDVDSFKSYNDTYGHPAGDVVLKSLAQLLQTNAREVDFAARYGGEEFVIIIPGDRAEALMIAERVRTVVERAAWGLRSVTASIGVSTFRSIISHPAAEALIVEADTALYTSKNNGRNRVTHADPETETSYICDTYAINAGGNVAHGTPFAGDSCYLGGSPNRTEMPVNASGLPAGPIRQIYQTERRGDFIYRIPNLALGGLYLVRLHFAETQYSQIGDRIFTISVNDHDELADFDILAETGAPCVAVVKELPVMVKQGGEILVKFTGKQNLATVNAIEVLPLKHGHSLAINCGATGVWPFVSDRYFNGGFDALQEPDASMGRYNLSTIDHSVPTSIYRSERYGDFTYTISGLPPFAPCLVTLHFCELYFEVQGIRIFNVAINDKQVIPRFDILEHTLVPFVPLVKRFFTTASANGEVVIDFQSLSNNAQAVAIEVHW